MGDTVAYFYDWQTDQSQPLLDTDGSFTNSSLTRQTSTRNPNNSKITNTNSLSKISSLGPRVNSSYVRPMVNLLHGLRLTVRCETPNDAISRFDGVLMNQTDHDDDSPGSGSSLRETNAGYVSDYPLFGSARNDESEISTGQSRRDNRHSSMDAGTPDLDDGPDPISLTNVVLRGCVLRQTPWLFGLVLNTGGWVCIWLEKWLGEN
jgi:hypothetical protein